jgi:uncharacterized protein (DUF1015 family)
VHKRVNDLNAESLLARLARFGFFLLRSAFKTISPTKAASFIMPEISAFRGVRYDLGHVGSLSEVVAPPYDVIDSELQDALYKQHPANCIRLILNREEPGDDELQNRYARAARFLKNWRHEGVMQTEPDPAIYVYHQTFNYEGQEFTRRGFMARIKLEPFGEGNIYPHEETHSAAKADRLLLTKACKANLSQIFGIYPDELNEAQDILENAIADTTPLEATDHLGVVHRFWPVTDVKAITEAKGVMGSKPMYIADGHHRYETACNYRDEMVAAGNVGSDDSVNYVLGMCVSMYDPGMIVLPTHRLFRGLAAVSSTDLVEKISACFDTRIAGEGADLASMIWEAIEVEGDQGTIGLYCGADQRWIVAKINHNGRAKLAEITPEHSDEWRELGVSILHRLILDTLLDATNLPKCNYVHQIEDVIDGLNEGDAENDDEDYPLAAIVMPATLDHIEVISSNNERMPAKSTYFFPKLLSGLVVNCHDV